MLEPMLPAPSRRGRPPTAHRQVIDAIFYNLRTGCQWRLLPKDFGPWETIYGRFRKWKTEGVWTALNDPLRTQPDFLYWRGNWGILAGFLWKNCKFLGKSALFIFKFQWCQTYPLFSPWASDKLAAQCASARFSLSAIHESRTGRNIATGVSARIDAPMRASAFNGRSSIWVKSTTNVELHISRLM